VTRAARSGHGKGQWLGDPRLAPFFNFLQRISAQLLSSLLASTQLFSPQLGSARLDSTQRKIYNHDICHDPMMHTTRRPASPLYTSHLSSPRLNSTQAFWFQKKTRSGNVSFFSF